MSAQKFTKGLVCFLFLSMFLILAACSSNVPSAEEGDLVPGEQQGISSSDNQTPSSSSNPSSNSVAASSSSSIAAATSSSSVAATSSSSPATSSSSVTTASSSSRATSSSSVAAASSSSSVAASSSSRATSSSSVAANSSSSVAATASSSSQASTPITTRSWTNVDYAATAPAANRHDRQRLDLKLPNSGDGPFPLILYVHGGGFTGGNWQLTSNNNGLISSAPNKGYAVASAGYLLYKNDNKPSFPQMVEDILAAIRHLRANASTYHLDPNKFVIAGYSAGGYLTNIVCALSGAATHTYDVTTLGNAGVSSNVQAAASSAGLTDFSKLVEQSGSTMHNSMAGGPLAGGSLTDNTQLMKDNLQKQNPLNWVSANMPPLYMRHSTNDNVVPWQQSQILFEKIVSVTPNAETLGKVKFSKRTSGGHDDFDSGSDTSDILNFLDRALGR